MVIIVLTPFRHAFSLQAPIIQNGFSDGLSLYLGDNIQEIHFFRSVIPIEANDYMLSIIISIGNIKEAFVSN